MADFNSLYKSTYPDMIKPQSSDAYCYWSGGGWEDDFQKRKPQRKMTLSNLAKKLFDADTKVLVKAGILDSQLDVTEFGEEVIFSHYVSANKKELAEEAKKILKEQD